MARHVRKGDVVYIRSGDDKGRTGRILKVIPADDRVVVEGVNLHKKHLRRSQANPEGGVVEREMPIHISNVSPVDDEDRPTRVRFETRPDGSKIRVAVTTGKQIGQELKKARS